MSRQILVAITQDFEPEIKLCGSASKCYCITCTRKRATTWKLFAAWRQVVRGKKNPAPVTLDTICNRYATSHPVFNEVVSVVQDHGNCNGLYAAGIATLIITYANPPTAAVVSIDYLNGTLLQSSWVGEPEVLTYWYDPQVNPAGTDHRWAYLKRRTLFAIFNETYNESMRLMPKITGAFDLLRRSVPMLSGGKFKNQVYIINCACVHINCSDTVHFNYKTSAGDIVGLWARYQYYFERVFGL